MRSTICWIDKAELTLTTRFFVADPPVAKVLNILVDRLVWLINIWCLWCLLIEYVVTKDTLLLLTYSGFFPFVLAFAFLLSIIIRGIVTAGSIAGCWVIILSWLNFFMLHIVHCRGRASSRHNVINIPFSYFASLIHKQLLWGLLLSWLDQWVLRNLSGWWLQGVKVKDVELWRKLYSCQS